MCLLIFLLCLGCTDCAKPRSVNIALETVFEFNNESDIQFVDTVQNFLDKIKFSLEKSYRRNDVLSRRFNSIEFTEFLEDLISTIKLYNDLDLTYFVELLDTEVNRNDKENCQRIAIKEFSLWKYFTDKLSEARDYPASRIRRSLNGILRELRNKNDQERGALFSFLNSLVKRQSREKFKSILNNLQLYRRRQMDPTMNLRTVVREGIGSVITDYICNLSDKNRQKIKKFLKTFNHGEPKSQDQINKNINRMHRLDTEKSDRNRASDLEDQKWRMKKKIINTQDFLDSSYNAVKERGRKQKIVHKKDSNEVNSDRNVKQRNVKEKETYLSKQTMKRKRKNKSARQKKPDDITSLELSSGDVTHKNKLKLKNNKALKDLKVDSASTEKYKVKSTFSSCDSDSIEYTNRLTTKGTKKATSSKHLKTFVTLYPEKIHIFINTIRADTKRKTTTDTVRKRFTIKTHNEKNSSRQNYDLITEHHSEIDVGFYKQKTSSKFNYTKPKSSRSKRRKPKTRTRKTTSKFQENTKNNRHLKSSTNDSKSIEHFGSLYKQNGQTYSDIFYRATRSYRKSNADSILIGDIRSEEEVSPDAAEIVETAEGHRNETSTTETKKTFGTLAFWSGTKKSTTRRMKTVQSFTNVTEAYNVTFSTQKVANNTKITSTSDINNGTTKKLFRSNRLNETKAIQNIIETSTLKNDSITKVSTVSKFTKKSTSSTKFPEKVKQMDLRRLLRDSVIKNEIQNDSINNEIDKRFKEDLKKIFLVRETPTRQNMTKDPIDEIEDVFNIS